ncbi:MAG TPA: glycoside hydrolase family 3 C-terminal domain-containing protein [Anaerolineae bacterium]|nr:glycoside hydrolase family 3 C-terminal domain-containing protein [Anaerolineae bacterium]HQK13991.1 glycoside hydrolase family 3 C-terminal domain-containing protein [Anaerolineae bacterium]
MEFQEKIKSLIQQMTLVEKASLCSGKDFWYLKGIARLGIPSIMVTDGPHGLRKQTGKTDHVGLHESVPATCFPTASALAATWNRDLIYQVGQALGEECRQEKVGVILGPGANIKRSPLCGRNFEYFSEDPYLTGEIAKSFINGVQSQGIGTSLKHYAVNNQEYRRMTIDAVVDERALREIYLPGYEIAVKGAQPWTVMCSYNKINGTYACENAYLMTDILKNEWGHEGLVVTDWGAMNERVAALKAGVELEMPGVRNGNDARIVAAVEAGQLDEAVLDRAVERILTLIFKAAETLSRDFTCDMQAHHALARRVAAEGAVLLKNDGDLLPLQKTTRFALIGRFAKVPRYQGAGSSLMNPTRLDNVYDEICKLTDADSLLYAPGYTEKGDQPDEALIQEALALAEKAEVVIICAGLTDLYETEGVDRRHMKLPPGHDALIQRIAAVHPNVVVVLSNGSPVEMPWVNDVPCILEGYLGGQAGAGGIADILFGVVNPSGKLAETFPLKLEDTPAYAYFPGGPATVEYRESLYVGYRYYDTVGQPVLFPFGHGLSYTRFAYRDLTLRRPNGPDDPSLTVTFKVKNIGQVAGQEVVQLYVRDVESTAFRPAKELKGFAKVALQPGEETGVTLELDRRAFAWYDPQLKDWRVEAGAFEILVGASSQDIRLSAVVEMPGTHPAAPAARTAPAVYHAFPKGARVSQEDFEALLGHPVPPNRMTPKGQYTLNTPVEDMQTSFIGRQLFGMIKKQMDQMAMGKEDTPAALLLEATSHEMPLRSMLMGDSFLSREILEALLLIMNGRFFKGVFALVRAVLRR